MVAHVREMYKNYVRQKMVVAGKFGDRVAGVRNEVKKVYKAKYKYANANKDLVASLDSSTAQKMCPPGAYCYKQTDCARWQITYERTTRSRSWGMHGFLASLLMVLKWAWKKELDNQGLDVIDCPVPGVFATSRSGKIKEDEENLKDELARIIR